MTLRKEILDVIFLVILSYGGYKGAERLKIPAPQVLGPMFSVMIGNLSGLGISVPTNFNTLITIGVGIIVGLQFNVRFDRRFAVQLLFAAAWMIVTGLLIGRLLILLGVQKDTAFFSAMPGGITELTFISMSFNADSFQVALFHATRMISLLVVFPIIIRRQPKGESVQMGEPSTMSSSKRPPEWFDWPVIVIMAASSGYILTLFRVPVGAFIGPLATTGVYTVKRRISLQMNRDIRDVTETCVGGAVGTRIIMESLKLVPGLLLPIIVLDTLVILSSVTLAKALHRTSDMDKVTCCLAAVPGGFSPFVVLARQMNANVSYVAAFHLCRYLSMIVFALLQGFLGSFG